MNPPILYEIRIQGHISDSWASWFEDLCLHHAKNGQTVLCGPLVDQAALHGVLIRIRDLGLPLVSVNRVANCEAYSNNTSYKEEDNYGDS